MTQIDALVTLASHAYVGKRRPAEVCAVGGISFALIESIDCFSQSLSDFC